MNMNKGFCKECGKYRFLYYTNLCRECNKVVKTSLYKVEVDKNG